MIFRWSTWSLVGSLVAVALLTRVAWADGPPKSIFDFDDEKPKPEVVKPKPEDVKPPTLPTESTAKPEKKPNVPKPVKPAPPPRPARPLLPVPNLLAQERALRQVKQQYQAEYRGSGSERAALARTLLEAGLREGTDPATAFVLLTEARDLASSAGDARAGLAAARQIAARYSTDLTEMGLGVLTTASRNATAPDRAAAVGAVAMALLGRAADAQRFDLAVRIATIAEASARRINSPPLASSLDAIQADLRTRKLNADKLPAARVALARNPADPEACAVIGRQLCLEEGNWSQGLVLLAKGNDAALKDLAMREAALPADPAAQAALANQWWTLAQVQAPTAKRRMQERAAEWYAKALPGLAGVTQDQASARIASAQRGTPKVVLMTATAPVDPAKATSQRDALRGGEALAKETVDESWAVDSDKPYALTGTAAVPAKGDRVDITMGPGAEIRGGKIYLAGKGHMTVRGTTQRPAILRDVTIAMDLGGSFDAEYAVLDGCTFKKEGPWYNQYSSKWTFKSCTLSKCKFPRLTGVDYGFRIESCRMIGMTFPEVIYKRDPTKEYNHLARLRRDWNRIAGCEFVDCAVPPTVAWCAEDSNFIGCKFLPGEAYEGDELFEWRAFISQTVGEAPQAVWDARPGIREKVKVVGLDRPADVPPVGENLLPEVTYLTKVVVRDD